MAENQHIGPYDTANIALCLLDASPAVQRATPGPAEFFFTRGYRVGAMCQVAQSVGCWFVSAA